MHREMAVRVIALEKEERQRRQCIDARLRALELDHHFVDACAPPTSTDQARLLGYDPQASRDALGRPLAMPEVGCFESHRRCWRQAAELGVPTLVLESDAVPDADTLKVIDALLEQPDRLPDLVMLHYEPVPLSFWQRRKLVDGYRLARFAHWPVNRTTGYLVTPRAAQRLLACSEKIFLPVDVYMNGGRVEKGIRVCAVDPHCMRMTDDADETSITVAQREALRPEKSAPRRNRGPARARLQQWRKTRRRWRRALMRTLRQFGPPPRWL